MVCLFSKLISIFIAMKVKKLLSLYLHSSLFRFDYSFLLKNIFLHFNGCD
jgi:hypothetical protein